MKVDVLLGLQWGDEGKGKVVDYLATKYKVVARFQGGPNAGHTLEFDGIKHVLHQIPSGIFRSDIKNVVGNGVVLDPVIFKKEIEELSGLGLDATQNLYISRKTQIILPTHRLLDAYQEKLKGSKKIGSTLKGIGPTYQDKIGRQGLRVGDIEMIGFEGRYKELRDKHLSMIEDDDISSKISELEPLFFQAVEYLKTLKLVDSEYLINEEIANNSGVLAEGAQGSLLDIDFGSYPFVTSSSTMVSGACSGLGVAPSKIGEVFGVFKAYCTRVGSGPFPTELFDKTGEKMRKQGHEFGATTGRPRRCGWLDLPALKYAIMINGVTQLFMMKADVLAGFDSINVCIGYELEDGSTTDKLPYDLVNQPVKPMYKELTGWNDTMPSSANYNDISQPLKDYIKFIEEEVGVPIKIVSLGPDRSETIIR
ncbi:MAG: adenylosuccinate synthase [Cyclobacteriaceae bacterium]|nr:adenylosuccinate synthase [Cyclobacteriaceae bacterium]